MKTEREYGIRFWRFVLILHCFVPFAGYAAPTIRPEILRSFPHDPSAFCQGLLYHNGYLYESTGQYGQSSLRKVELETGNVLKKEMLPSMLFGEGLAVCEGKLYQLTWKSRIGLVWYLESFRLLRNVQYDSEGWGLTCNGKKLIRSDGSHILHFHDPKSFAVESRISIMEQGRPVRMLNELEFIEGLVFANIWLTDSIAVLDPRTGRLICWIDCSGLLSAAEQKQADVLNGIAFDAGSKRLYITGKNWPKLFELDYAKLKKTIAGIRNQKRGSANRPSKTAP